MYEVYSKDWPGKFLCDGMLGIANKIIIQLCNFFYNMYFS